MSDSEAKAVVGVIFFAIAITAMVAHGITSGACTRYWQSEAIARGVAGYDEKTGEWKWTVERKVAE